ncbi:hypothetical protein NUACC21_60590 [Scytonema sp. NUACC21]
MSRFSKQNLKLSSQKQALLETLLQKEGIDSAPSQKITPRKDVSSLPLSFAQQRLWFFDQFAPGTPAYNIPAALRLKGQVNVMALQQSFNEILQRHEALQTTFATVEGQPVQVITSKQTLALPVVDLQDLPKTEREAQALQLATEEAQQPFNLAQDLLLRAKLLRLDKDDYVLLLTMHHIVCDGWSVKVLIRELTALYEAFAAGKPSPLPKLPIQYADFALWQRQWLQGDVLKTQLGYWKQQLAHLPVLQLPTDRPRAVVQSLRGAAQFLMLSKSLTEALKALSQQEGLTLFMTLLAAFKTLLYRYTGQDDIVVGSGIANRNRPEIEGLIGFFVNTLVLRSNLSGNPSFRELLGRVREITLQAYAHQDLPFEKLVEELQPERHLSHQPLFQTAFFLQNAPKSVLELPCLTLSYLEVETKTAKFDLMVDMVETRSGLCATCEYSTDLFDASTIRRMLGHFQTLLEGIVAAPSQRLSDLPLLTEAERLTLVEEWNPTGVDYPQNLCIHQLFEAQVERIPDAVAVTFEDQQLTYLELNQRANQLAHYLRSLGVKPDSLVGLCVERSLEMVVGLLAILKAGGAYVPLDPAYPQERLAFMLEDSQALVLLTQQQLLQKLPKHKARVVCLDSNWETNASSTAFPNALHSLENPTSKVTPDNLAYVIYTSGSTGKPKGVLVNHSNVLRLFEATDSWFHFDERDVCTLFHSYAFDFSVWELWSALLHGGRLVVVPYWVSRSPTALYDLLYAEQVTVLNQTPSAFRQLIQTQVSSGVTEEQSLRLVIFGGEALDLQSLKPWFERNGDECPQLINMYGITETTVHVTYRPLMMSDLRGTGSVIGGAIPDLQVYMLDRYLQPVPIGVPGEMYISGAGLARGYLNRPELTAQRFIPNPFSDKPGARLYKTGDLARYLPNGDIEYLGRIDVSDLVH